MTNTYAHHRRYLCRLYDCTGKQSNKLFNTEREIFREGCDITVLVPVLPLPVYVRVESAALDASVFLAGPKTIDSDPQKLCPDVFPLFGGDLRRHGASRLARGVADFRSGIRRER